MKQNIDAVQIIKNINTLIKRKKGNSMYDLGYKDGLTAALQVISNLRKEDDEEED